MMHITHPDIEAYIAQYSKHLTPELEDLERETFLKVLLPNMLSGKEQGRFLYQFTKALNPKLALELGTYTGYSAICIALGMADDSKLITLDINEDIAWLPRKYFERCGLEERIHYILMPAIAYISSIEDNNLDMVFVDADKQNYPQYYQSLKPKLKKGGYLLIDNVLWNGRVLDSVTPNRDTLAIQEMTKLLFNDSDFICSILPLRDGILIAQKNF